MRVAPSNDSLLPDVLAVARIDDVLRDAGITPPANEKINIPCPLPDHAHSNRKSTPSFSVQKSGQGYRCFGCGAHGGVVELVVALKLARSKKDAVDLLAARYGLAKSSGGHSARPVGRPTIAQLNLSPVAPSPQLTAEERAELLDALRGGYPLLGSNGERYVASRGIDPAFAVSCRIGYHPAWLGRGEAVIFLGFDLTGHLACAQGRYLSPTVAPKARSRGKVSLGVFSTPQAFAKGLYGQGEPVAITEAPFDAVALAQNGLPSIAIFGSSNRQAWLRKALAGRDVILAFDDDRAGEEAAEAFRTFLNRGTDTRTGLRFAPYKDAAEMLEKDPGALALLVEETLQQVRSWYGVAIPEAEHVSDLLHVVSGIASSVPESEAEDGLSLLDYAGKVLGWHEDWPEARPSNWDSLPAVNPRPTRGIAHYTLDGVEHPYEYDETVTLPAPTPVEELRATPVLPSKAKAERYRAKHVNRCACGQSFEGASAQASADALKSHIHDNPCQHYRNPSELELPNRKPLREGNLATYAGDYVGGDS
jgi:DNA primase